jgi:hypothetical protein
MSDLSPECAPKRTFADHSGFIGFTPWFFPPSIAAKFRVSQAGRFGSNSGTASIKSPMVHTRSATPGATRRRSADSSVQRPEPGPVGPSVDPLGEVLMKLLPDGFRPLLAPAAALPALVLTPPLVALPVVVPFVEEVAPVAADPPVAELPAAEPPACANAKLLVSASAAANPIVASFMVDSIAVADQGQSAGRVYVPITSGLRTLPLAAGYRKRLTTSPATGTTTLGSPNLGSPDLGSPDLQACRGAQF